MLHATTSGISMLRNQLIITLTDGEPSSARAALVAKIRGMGGVDRVDLFEPDQSIETLTEEFALFAKRQAMGELVNINNYVQRLVFRASNVVGEAARYEAWKNIFGLIFSNSVSTRARELFEFLNLEFDWHDPDTSYEADVCAYARALNEKVIGLEGLNP